MPIDPFRLSLRLSLMSNVRWIWLRTGYCPGSLRGERRFPLSALTSNGGPTSTNPPSPRSERTQKDLSASPHQQSSNSKFILQTKTNFQFNQSIEMAPYACIPKIPLNPGKLEKVESQYS